jgi:hypothetical protein
VVITVLICSLFSPAVFAQGISSEYYPSGLVGGGVTSLTIPGLEGFQGFVEGENQISLATYMVSQDQGRLYFEVVGIALSNPYSPQCTVYTLNSPLMGVMDQSANTIQVDMSNLAAAVGSAGTIDKSSLYSALRTNENVFVINMDATYQGTSGNQRHVI